MPMAAACYCVLLYSSTHFCSASPFDTTTKLKHPSLTSNPSSRFVPLALVPPAARHTSRSVIFFPTFNSLFFRVAAYTTSDPTTYRPSVSHDGAGAPGGNMVPSTAPNSASSIKSGTTSDVACSGYRKNTGMISVVSFASSGSNRGAYGLAEPSGFGILIRLRS
jgi:hypothetical protein